jgi:hypothetical protein
LTAEAEDQHSCATGGHGAQSRQQHAGDVAVLVPLPAAEIGRIVDMARA